ncbi:MAG: LCP family protein, partial [Eubacterium sp.]
MPKYNNNDNRDRSVPNEENYYARRDIDDFGIEKYSSAPVIDRQNRYDDYEQEDIMPPIRNSRQSQEDFVPQVIQDFDNQRRPQRQPSNKKNRNKKNHKLSKTKVKALSVVAVLLVIVLLLNTAVNAMLGKITYDEKVDNQYVTSSQLKSSPWVKNILLLGVDARKGEDATKSRSDSMMIVSIDLKHKAIKTVSFLRDTWVYIPCHEGEQRLNAACTYGGYSGVSDTIEYNFGIKIDGYVVVNFGMFQTLVDSLGGVEIDVTEKEANEINNHQKRYGNVKIESG